jgi:hypothetical protein
MKTELKIETSQPEIKAPRPAIPQSREKSGTDE